MSLREPIITPNVLITAARRRMPSPERRGQAMSRHELAWAINVELHRTHGNSVDVLDVDARWIGKLERGGYRWPSAARRAILRNILRADTDADLGLRGPHRRSIDTSP